MNDGENCSFAGCPPAGGPVLCEKVWCWPPRGKYVESCAASCGKSRIATGCRPLRVIALGLLLGTMVGCCRLTPSALVSSPALRRCGMDVACNKGVFRSTPTRLAHGP